MKRNTDDFTRVVAAAEMIARGKGVRAAAAHLGLSQGGLRNFRNEHSDLWAAAYAEAVRNIERPQSRKLADLAQQYFKLNLRCRNPATHYQYSIALRDFERTLGHEPTTADLQDDTVTIWIRDMLDRNLAERSAAERAGRIGTLWTWLAKRGVVKTFPTFAKPRPPETMPTALTESQLVRLFQSAARERGDVAGVPAHLWWCSFLAFIWNTGERKSAVLAVKLEWLDFERQQCVIPPGVRKGGRKYGVYRLWPETVPVLRAAVMANPARALMWPWELCPESYYIAYNRILRDAGIPVTRRYKTHALRCTHATMKQVLGGDATRAMGHSDPATTQRHYIDPRMLQTDDVKMFIPWQQPAVMPTMPTQPMHEPEEKRPAIAEELGALAWL